MVRSLGVLRRGQCDALLTACMSGPVSIDDTVSCTLHLCMGLRSIITVNRAAMQSAHPLSRTP